MNNTDLIGRLSFTLSSVAYCQVGKEWNYRDIISSFSRLMLVTGGGAMLQIGGRKVPMRPGFMYLVPSFLNCSYHCPESMDHYYATFAIDLPDRMNVYQLFEFSNEVRAGKRHADFFEELKNENPCMALPSGDPRIYQKRYLNGVGRRIQAPRAGLKTSGLLNLLLSDFIGSPRMDLENQTHASISASLRILHLHLEEEDLLDRLARETCLSRDHYTRKFKELTGQTPLEYINRQRIEKAQMLLSTGLLSCADIAYQCGFKSNAYFSRVFKRHINASPSQYRKQQMHLSNKG